MLTKGLRLAPTTQQLVIDGSPLSLSSFRAVALHRSAVSIADDPAIRQRVEKSVQLVLRAVEEGEKIYGVTTGFGGMADHAVPCDMATASQNNLLSFLAAGAGPALCERHVRGAMLLRANVLLQGCSGVRMQIIQRLIQFLESEATPVVRELGSIGASGDLVPLAAIARAITGQSDYVEVQLRDKVVSGAAALRALGLQPIELRPKEGLALVNGTSFSSSIAANVMCEAKSLMAVATGVQAMMLRALQAQRTPFEPFVQQCKPHPGQVWSAKVIQQWLDGPTIEEAASESGRAKHVQDRYSIRCFPQYLGPIAEGMARAQQTVETEMNGVSDNPLIDVESESFFQSGNFLAQYIGVVSDDVRRFLGLLAKHLDVQIATLVAPEFNGGLSPSLRGNDAVPYNMGLKGLQISGNSIMPLLTYLGNPLVEHFPTHAEQFNQNINGLGWGAANLAWKSVELFRQYLSIALVFAVQALDLRAQHLWGHYDGSELLGDYSKPLYLAALEVVDQRPSRERPLLFDDSDRWLEADVAALARDMDAGQRIIDSARTVIDSFNEHFGLDP